MRRPRPGKQEPPADRVLVAGTTGGIPAVARLLRVVAGLPSGAVVLPGLDTAMSELAWEELDDAHPQAGLARLLHGLGATRGDVRVWPAAVPDAGTAARGATLSRALLPAKALGRSGRTPRPAAVDGLTLLSPADQQEEAAAIALVLREALETPGARAALVTPDRDLAGRVADRAAALRRGRRRQRGRGAGATRRRRCSCACWPAPWPRSWRRSPLLALLKHPLAAAGLAPGRLPRGGARAGTRLPARSAAGAVAWPGCGARSTGHVRRAATRPRCWRGWKPAWSRRCGSTPRSRSRRPTALAALIEAAERLAATDELPGPGAAVGRRGRRGAGDPARRRAGRAAAAAGPAARRAARACWMRCWRARSCAAAGHCVGATAPSIRACSSGACWRRGCRPPT